MTSFDQLPPPILDKLRSMIRRVRRLLLLRGLFATFAVALACLLAIMAVDASVTLFSSTSRWLLSLAGLAATLVAAWWFLVRPLSRRFTLAKMARILEIRHPELQERISTAVELLASDDPESIRGSQELIAAIVDSAVADVATVDPKTEFKPARSKKFMVAAAAGTGLILLLLAIWPRQSWTLLARALAPFADIGNAYADTLVVDPGDVRVAKGTPITVQVAVKHKRLKRAELRRRLPDGSDAVERMNLVAEEPDGTKRFSLTFPAVEDGFDYRVRAGAALSRYFDVHAIDPPAVESLTVRYGYPDYTGLSDAEAPTETGEIRAVAHTRIAVVAALSKAVGSATLLFDESEGAPAEALVDGTRATWEFDLKPGMRGGWHLELADEEGFANRPATYPVEALPDKAPTVQIVAPLQRDLRLKPAERLPIDLDVVEDFGFGDVVLMVTPDGAVVPTEVPQPVPVPTGRPGHYAARALLDLPALKLAPEQRRLAVQVRVLDNRPAEYDGPGIGLSETIFITLDEGAKSLADQTIEAQRQEIERQIREARQELERARDDLRRTEQELQKTDEINGEARKRLDEFTQHNKAAREALGQIAATLDTPLFQEQSRQAATLADEPLAEAQEKADLIPMTDARHERVAEAKEARTKIEEAIQGLDGLAKSMREAHKDYEAIARLNQLATHQQELAQQAGDWTERAAREAAATREAAQQAADENARRQAMEQFDQQQRREAEQFRNEQNRVEQQLGEMLKDNAAALAEILAQQRAQSDELSSLAQALAERQEALREVSRDATERSESTSQETLREALIGQLAQFQSRLAQQAKTAAEEAKNTEALAQAAGEAEQAAGHLGEAKLDEAGAAAKQASQSLARAAEPSSSPQAQEFAARQEALVDQIEAVREGRLQEALARMESLLESDAALLEAQARGMEASLLNLRQNQAKDRVREAAQSLDRGEQRAAQSSRQFARAQEQQNEAEAKSETADGELAKAARTTMRQAQGEQQQSAQALAQAANAFSRSSEAIGQTLEGLEASDMDERLANSEDLARGFQDVARSSQSQSAQEAAEQSQQAADSLQRLAEAAMRRIGGRQPAQAQPGEPGTQPPKQELSGEPDSTELNETGQKTADWDGSGLPPELSQLGISAADWARFKGALVGGNATAIETDLPAEYRELVGRYFQVIAKEAGKGK